MSRPYIPARAKRNMFDDPGKALKDWAGPASPIYRLYNRHRRHFKPAAIALAVFFCIWYFLFSSSGHHQVKQLPHQFTKARFYSAAPSTHPSRLSQNALEFWREFTDALAKSKPSFDEVKRTSDKEPWIAFKKAKQDGKRPDNLELSKEQLDELRRLRKQAISDFGHLGSKLPFDRGTRGIVTTAGNDAFPILTTSLWMLRESGSTLPVEIWFYDRNSWEDVPCGEIFPAFGAKCLFMEDHLPKDLKNPLEIAKYTNKPLALAFSSFEQALFLDCDNFPVMNPDSIFETEPFKTYNFVLWPDYWASTASKYLYDIIGAVIPDLRERATSEAGQILIDKSSHSAVLLLSIWYNVYGPKYWHRLLSQKAPGEGDKDTYLISVKDYNLPWYQVNEPPQRVGYRCDGKKRPVGSAQSHPLDDYKFIANGAPQHEDGFDLAESSHPRVLFLHHNLPKLDPYLLLEFKMGDWDNILRCDHGEGEYHRMWGPKELAVVKYGWDVERAAWDAMRWAACVQETSFSIWTKPTIFRPENKLRHDLCAETSKIWDALFPGERFVPELPKVGERQERPWGGWPDPNS